MAEHDLKVGFEFDDSNLRHQLTRVERDIAEITNKLNRSLKNSDDQIAVLAQSIQEVRREMRLLDESVDIWERFSRAGTGATVGLAINNPTVAAGGGLAGFFSPEIAAAAAAVEGKTLKDISQAISLTERAALAEKLAELANTPIGPYVEDLRKQAREETLDLVALKDALADEIMIARTLDPEEIKSLPGARTIDVEQRMKEVEVLNAALKEIARLTSDSDLKRRLATSLPQAGPTPDAMKFLIQRQRTLEGARAGESATTTAQGMGSAPTTVPSVPLPDQERLAALLAEQSIQAEELTGKLGELAAAAEQVTAAFRAWEEIGEIVKGVHESLMTWLVDKFTQVIAGVEDATGKVLALWMKLKDELVENSIVPDMIDEIGALFGRLPEVMVVPSRSATESVAQSFGRMGDRVSTDMGTVTDGVARRFDELGRRVGGAISEMVRTGEFKLSGFRSFLADFAANLHETLLKMFVFDPLSGFLGSLFGGGAALGTPAQQLAAGVRPLAHGGPAAAGMPLLVGERGPEIFVPNLAGTVLSNRQSRAALGGGGYRIRRTAISPYWLHPSARNIEQLAA